MIKMTYENIEKIAEFIEKSIRSSKKRYPIIFFYKEFNSEIFDKFSAIENRLSELNEIKTLRLARLSINENYDSFYSNFVSNCRNRSHNFISNSNKIIIIDTFIPFGLNIDYSNNREIVGFIMNFYNSKSLVNFTNSFLILGMTINDKLNLSSNNPALRRYFANEPLNFDSFEHISQKNENGGFFEIEYEIWPTNNISSILNINPLNWILREQLIRYNNFIPSNDPLVNIVKKYSEVNFFLSRFPVIEEEFNVDETFNETTRKILEVQKFNILQSLEYLKKLKNKIIVNEIYEKMF